MKIIKYQNSGKLRTVLKKAANKFSQATLRAAMADRPEVMQASGWDYDKNGNIVQGDPSADGPTALRKSLAEIAAMPAIDLVGDVAGAAVAGTKLYKSVKLAKELNKAIKNTTPSAQVKYYGPTMGKSYAAKTNPNLIDLDTWGRSEYDQLAKKYGYKDWREMIVSDRGDYNAEYKQLIKDQIKRIQSDPQYNGKTIVVSNASFLNPNSEIKFANIPTIPERSVMARRNNIRHPWESVEHGEQWWDSLQSKGTPLKIDNRFVSEIEGNKVITFIPKQPQPSATTYNFNYGMPKKTIPLTESEKLGIPKHERPMYDPEVLQKAKLFAEEYGYPEPTTIKEIKDMYKRHNTFFRTVSDLENTPETKELYKAMPDWFKKLSTEEQRKVLASKGYPKYMRYYFDTPNNMDTFTDGFVFVSPSLEENSSYFINESLNNTVKLQRPFSLRNPKTWHKEADWRIFPANSWKEQYWPKGRIEIGNADPSIEFKVSTKNLIPVDIAKPEDLGTLLPNYLRDKVKTAISTERFSYPEWIKGDPYYGNYKVDYFGIKPEKFTYKQGGILKAQKGSFENWYKTVPKSYNDTTNYNLRRAYELAPLKELEAWKNDPQKNHLRSVYLNNTGEYEFMKSPNHPTINKELEWFNSKDAEKFRKKYYLDSTSSPWKYKLK